MFDSHEADWRRDKRIFLIYQRAYQSANKEVIWRRLKVTFEKHIFIRSTIVVTKSTNEKENRKKDTDELLNSVGEHLQMTNLGTMSKNHYFNRPSQLSLPSPAFYIKEISWQRKTKMAIILAQTFITTMNTNFYFCIVPLTRFLTKGW